MSKYTSELKRIVSIFHSYRNDIDIYVEEGKGNKELYSILLGKLLEDCDLKVKDVFPIGNREQLIDICVKDDTIGRKKLYIVNGEFDFVNDKYMVNHNNLFYLDSFDIENKLINEESVCKIVSEKQNLTLSKAKQKLNFPRWESEYADVLKELFLHYSILHELDGFVDFGDASSYLVKKRDEYVLDTTKVRALIVDLKQKILDQISKETYEDMIRERLERWKLNNSFLFMVSGKKFLLPLLQKRLEKIGLEDSINEFNNIRLFLVNNCSISKLQKLKETLQSVSA